MIEYKILTTHQKSKQTTLLAGQKHATFLYSGLSENIWSSQPITVNEMLEIYGENRENQSQMKASVTKKCLKSQRPEVIKGFDCSK